jgi:hypothetical protein
LPEPFPKKAAPLGLDEPEQALDQGTLAGTVLPGDTEIIPPFHRKIESPHRRGFFISKGQVPAANDDHRKKSFVSYSSTLILKYTIYYLKKTSGRVASTAIPNSTF